MAAAGATQANHDGLDSGNAALRYWAAFSELRDSAITAQQAKELNAILDGTAPYDDSKYEDLVKKNQLALEIMSRGTLLRLCDWGLDYDLGADMPVEYAREALTLGRLNVLYIFHLLKSGNMEGVVKALVAGLRFSHDVGNGGSLFATIVAKSLLTDHLRAITDVLRLGQLTADQNSRLQTAVAALSPGLDWSSAAKRDLEPLRRYYAQSPQAAAALNRITSTYIAAVDDGSNRVAVERAIKAAPKDLANVIPNLEGVLKQKQDLSDAIRQTRAALQ
jgi:hypothetical protein